MDKVFVGVDVAKEKLPMTFFPDGAIAGEAKALQIANEPGAISTWLEQARSLSLALVAFEPTGGYERALRRALLEAGVAFAIVHPNEVVAFRKVRGSRPSFALRPARRDRGDRQDRCQAARRVRAGRARTA